MADEESETPAVMRDASEEEDTNVCFVCMGGNAPRSKCACTDRHVHDECMMQWLKQQRTNTCPVCMEAYPHVGFQIKTRVRPSCPCWGTLLGAVCFLGLFTCGIIQIWMYLDPGFISVNLSLASGMAMIAGGLVGLFVCLLFGMRFRRQNFRIFERESKKTVVLQAVSGADV